MCPRSCVPFAGLVKHWPCEMAYASELAIAHKLGVFPAHSYLSQDRETKRQRERASYHLCLSLRVFSAYSYLLRLTRLPKTSRTKTSTWWLVAQAGTGLRTPAHGSSRLDTQTSSKTPKASLGGKLKVSRTRSLVATLSSNPEARRNVTAVRGTDFFCLWVLPRIPKTHS